VTGTDISNILLNTNNKHPKPSLVRRIYENNKKYKWLFAQVKQQK